MRDNLFTLSFLKYSQALARFNLKARRSLCPDASLQNLDRRLVSNVPLRGYNRSRSSNLMQDLMFFVSRSLYLYDYS